jgi:hypothetical protein
LTKVLGVSRSRLYAEAIAECLGQRRDTATEGSLNAVCDEQTSEPLAELSHAQLPMLSNDA